MSNKEEPLSEQQEERLESAFKPVVRKTIDKVYAPLSWCWPTTIALLLVRWILNSTGHYYMSFELATVFLWAPVVIIIGLTSFFILIFYLLALFGAWHTFMQNIVFYFKLGFGNGSSNNQQKHIFYTPNPPELENQNKKDENKDDEAL